MCRVTVFQGVFTYLYLSREKRRQQGGIRIILQKQFVFFRHQWYRWLAAFSCADRTWTAAQMSITETTHGRGEFRPQSCGKVSLHTGHIHTYIHTYRPPTGVRSRGNWRKGVKTDSPSGEANTCAERIFTNHTLNAKTRHGEKRAMMALNWPVSGKWSSRQTEQNQRAKERNPSTLYIPIKLPVRLIFAKKSDFILELSLPWNKMAELIWVPWKHYKASEKTKFPNQYLEF